MCKDRASLSKCTLSKQPNLNLSSVLNKAVKTLSMVEAQYCDYIKDKHLGIYVWVLRSYKYTLQ